MNRLGEAAEDEAAAFLGRQGLQIRERNWQCRFGEIDLIAQDGNTLVFVEVRMRNNARFGGAAASITPAKQAKLLASAAQYLQGLRRQPECRFDAVCIENGQIQWLKNCISA